MSPFFVGWMGLPRSLVGFVSVVILAVATAGAVFAALIIAATPPHQSGLWGSDEVGYDGVLVTKPYPLVRVAASGNQPARTILLVDEWKFGLPLGPEFKDGQFVHVQGYAVRRVVPVRGDPGPVHHAGTGRNDALVRAERRRRQRPGRSDARPYRRTAEPHRPRRRSGGSA